MRMLLCLLLCAVAPLASALDTADARHLLVRSGFQPDAAEIAALADLEHAEAVQRIVSAAAARTEAATPLPAWHAIPIGELRFQDRDAAGKRALRAELREQALTLQAWWFTEMVRTPTPLTERMTLFWHDHFTTALYDVNKPPLLLRQNQLLRRHALGNFRELLHAVARDPAMLIWLDAGLNRAGRLNENFAREVMELFTLGEGHYDEHDIREAARAFTGWAVHPQTGEVRFAARRFDAGEKTVLGQTGNFDADALLELLLARPETAEFIVAKLWREFVSDTPEPAEVRRLAAAFRQDYEIAPLISALLNSAAFRAAGNRGTLVKSPVEFVVGTDRALDLDTPPELSALATSTMGQTLFNPPNVKGWPENTGWLSTESLLARRQYLSFLLGDMRGLAPPKAFRSSPKAVYAIARPQQADIQARIAATAESARGAQLQATLLNLPPVIPAEDGSTPPERLAGWLLDPVYQLK